MEKKKYILIAAIVLSATAHSQCWNHLTGTLYNSFGILDDGSLWSWGKNYNGMLGVGDGSAEGVPVPIQVGTATDWELVAAGKGLGRHVAAIKMDGTLWTWGRNDLGQLADGTNIDKNVPSQVGSESNWQSVSCGQNFMIALKDDGTLWSSGSNMSVGLLGTGGPDTNILTQIGTDSDWVSIVCAQNSAFAIKSNGSLWAWGSNAMGSLGIGVDSGIYPTPVQVGTATNWVSIASEAMSAAGLRSDGTLWA